MRLLDCIALIAIAVFVAPGVASQNCYVDKRAMPRPSEGGAIMFGSFEEAKMSGMCTDIYARVASDSVPCLVDERATPATDGYGDTVFATVTGALKYGLCRELYIRHIVSDYYCDESARNVHFDAN